MIPQLTALAGSPWDVLPPCVHAATLSEVEAAFAYNERRQELYTGLIDARVSLALAGCRSIILDGSYVSGKPVPGDYDACWDPAGIDFSVLDPVFGDFSNDRAKQKARFKGEFFPSTMIAADIGGVFVDFIQIDRFTGQQKGILSIPINTDPVVVRRKKP